MQKLKSLLSLLCVLLHWQLLAGVLHGKVTDEKGAPLPYATIYLEGTTTGVTANVNGNYELTVAPGLYKVVCQYISYKQSTYNLSITGNETKEHNFVLKDQSLEMKEVVIHASTEDPAYPIIRNAIKKRKVHLEQTKSFQTSIYLKGVIRSRAFPGKVLGQKVQGLGIDSLGKGVLYLTEEDADYYNDAGKEKTVIHSVHESGDPNGVGFSQFPSVITFYNNNVNVFEDESRGYISPISDNALFYYKYKLMGQFDEQGHTIYKIQVIPKRAYEPCFTGTIYIVDEDWAIHSTTMTLAKKSGMDVVDTLTIDQLYLPLQKDAWVIKSQVLYFTLNLLGFDITGTGVTVYNKQKIKEPIRSDLFADRITSFYDKGANKKDTSYWTGNRPIPLEKDEVRDFVVKDSIIKVLHDPAYIDSVRRKKNKLKVGGLLLSGSTFSSKEYKNIYSINSVLLGFASENMINFNTVEGFEIAPKLNWIHKLDTNKALVIDAAVRYGYSNTHFNAIGRIYHSMRDKTFLNRSWVYGAEGGKYVFQYDPDNPVMPWFNTYSALIYRQNDLKIYERWEASGFLRHNNGHGLTWFIKASYQQRLPLQNTSTYSFFNGDEVNYASNTPPHLFHTATTWEKNDAALIYATVSYKPGYTYTQYPDYKVANGSKWPMFTLSYDKGIPRIFNSVSDFDKWRFMVQGDVRLRLLGTLKYNIGCGGFLNTTYVSIPDLMHLYGNRGIGYASPYLQSFQFAQYYEFSNTAPIYGEAHLEHHLNGLLSNKIPLLRQQRWYLLFGGNAFYASQNDYYTEAFIGIDNIGWKLVRPLRFDFVQSWDYHGGRNSGIRFGVNLDGLTTPKVNVSHSEW